MIVSTGSSTWPVIEALASTCAVILTVVFALFAFSKDKNTDREIAEKERDVRRKQESQKLDSVVLAVVGRPASVDGTFAHIPGLVDQVQTLADCFSEHRAEVLRYQEKSDADILAITSRLDYVATQYVTNGGSTVKDDLIVIRKELTNLRVTVDGILDGQVQAASKLITADRSRPTRFNQ